MLTKNKNLFFIFALLLTDCFSFLISFFTAFYFRFYTVHLTADYFILLFYLIPIWILFVNFFVGHKLFYISLFDLFIKTVKATVYFIIFILAMFFIISHNFSRLIIVFFAINLVFFTLLLRYPFKRTIAYVIYKLDMRNNLLVIGAGVKNIQ